MVPRWISEKITSTISTAWYLTTKSDGIWKRPFDFPILGLAQGQPDMETLVKNPVLREKLEAPVNKELGVTAQAQ